MPNALLEAETTEVAPANILETPAESAADAHRGDAFYNHFYRTGGWKYSAWREYWWHRKNLVRRFHLRRRMTLLEVACGNGFHTNLLAGMGFDCVGVDRSSAGIEWAQKHYPRRRFIQADIMDDLPVAPGSIDVVLARGCSHYHYDLRSEKARSTTRHLIRYLKPGGVFAMIIVSDLSGRRRPGEVWQNTLADYEAHFASFDRRWSVDWVKGVVICGLWNTPRAGN